MSTKFKKDKINFAPNNLTLRSFLATRSSLKNNTKFLVKSAEIYKKACKAENQPNAKMRNIYAHLIGNYTPNPMPCVNLRYTKLDRKLTESKSFHLPPNIYDTNKVPFASRRGAGSASWSSLPRFNECTNNSAFYETSRELDRLTKRANKHKGRFLANIVSRCVAKRRPLRKHLSIAEEVTPTMYNPQQHTVAYNAASRTHTPKPNPHLFLRRSCVPEKRMSFLPRHQSFLPAVGRYDVTQSRSRQLSSDEVRKIYKNKRKVPSQRSPVSQRSSVPQRPLLFPVVTTRMPPKLLASSSPAHRHRQPISRRSYELNNVKPKIRPSTYTVPWKPVQIAKNNEKSRASTSTVAARHLVSPSFGKGGTQRHSDANSQYKRNFKFLPLPLPKILVRKTDLLPDLLTGESTYLYFRDIDVNSYLKKEAHQLA